MSEWIDLEDLKKRPGREWSDDERRQVKDRFLTQLDRHYRFVAGLLYRMSGRQPLPGDVEDIVHDFVFVEPVAQLLGDEQPRQMASYDLDRVIDMYESGPKANLDGLVRRWLSYAVRTAINKRRGLPTVSLTSTDREGREIRHDKADWRPNPEQRLVNPVVFLERFAELSTQRIDDERQRVEAEQRRRAAVATTSTCVERLPSRQRIAFTMRYGLDDDVSRHHDEIALRLKISVGNSRVLLCRAKSRLERMPEMAGCWPFLETRNPSGEL